MSTTIKTIPIEDRYYTYSFKNYLQSKNILLNLITQMQSNSILDNHQNISKTDWKTSKDVKRYWIDTFMAFFQTEIKTAYEQMGFPSFKIHNFWFQEYNFGSYHNWHTHPECNFSNIYYLELPENCQTTQFKLHDGKEIFADAKEGDLLIFPAHILHRAVKNNSESKRIVIVFNTSIEHCE